MGLSFLAGLVVSVLGWAPYRWACDAAAALSAVREQQRMAAERYSQYLWYPALSDKRGVTKLDRARVQAGLTLMSAEANCEPVLVNIDGTEVHRWRIPFHQVFPGVEFSKQIIPEHGIFVRQAHVEPNGDLIALYETPLTTPNGMGLVRVDRDSHVIWARAGNFHHDFTPLSDGGIAALSQYLRRSERPELWFGFKTSIEDFVAVLDGQGTVVKEFSLVDALIDSPFFRPEIFLREQQGDLLHANSIHVVGEEFASQYDKIDAKNVMICLRNINLVVIVDLDSERIVWATSGPWHFPHDPDPLPNGNILIFNNCFARGDVSGSRVIEFDPRSREIAWSFGAESFRNFKSNIRSGQQKLANGNILITESCSGRIMEVTPQGEVVWEYLAQVRGGPKENLTPVIAAVRRVDQNLPFIQTTLTPSADGVGTAQGTSAVDWDSPRRTVSQFERAPQ